MPAGLTSTGGTRRAQQGDTDGAENISFFAKGLVRTTRPGFALTEPFALETQRLRRVPARVSASRAKEIDSRFPIFGDFRRQVADVS